MYNDSASLAKTQHPRLRTVSQFCDDVPSLHTTVVISPCLIHLPALFVVDSLLLRSSMDSNDLGIQSEALARANLIHIPPDTSKVRPTTHPFSLSLIRHFDLYFLLSTCSDGSSPHQSFASKGLKVSSVYLIPKLSLPRKPLWTYPMGTLL